MVERKQNMSVGLLAHVCAGRREPRKKLNPRSENRGFFMPCDGKPFSKGKNTTICCGFVGAETAAYGGRNSKFGFVAVLRAENEVSIDENISVGYKGESRYSIELLL